VITGLQKGDEITISLAGFDDEDISLMLPLWAGLLSTEQAGRMVSQTLLPRYLSKFGLAALPIDRYPDHLHTSLPFWNATLTEGLLNYGLRENAAEVFQAFLAGSTSQWQTNGKINDAIRTDDGRGVGNQDNVNGLVVLLPFLRTLGIERVFPKEIIFNGLNDYLTPFTVQYGRAEVQMNRDCTTISTVNGSKIEIIEAGMQKSILP